MGYVNLTYIYNKVRGKKKKKNKDVEYEVIHACTCVSIDAQCNSGVNKFPDIVPGNIKVFLKRTTQAKSTARYPCSRLLLM